MMLTSIHSFSYLWLGRSGSRISSLPSHFPAPPVGSCSVPRLEEICNLSSEFGIWPGVSSQLDMPGKTSKGRQPGGILIRCLNHFNWLLLSQRSSGSTPRPHQMSKLRILYLWLSPVILWSKLRSVTSIHKLVFSVTTHSAWPYRMTIAEQWWPHRTYN